MDRALKTSVGRVCLVAVDVDKHTHKRREPGFKLTHDGSLNNGWKSDTCGGGVAQVGNPTS